MSNTEQRIYPRGRIALDSGDLVDVTNVKVSTTNNAKQVHTLRQPGAGVTMGNPETTITFDVAISEDGMERNYLEMVRKGTLKQIRIKVPGATINVEGVFKETGFELPLDSEIKQNLSFIGKITD